MTDNQRQECADCCYRQEHLVCCARVDLAWAAYNLWRELPVLRMVAKDPPECPFKWPEGKLPYEMEDDATR